MAKKRVIDVAAGCLAAGLLMAGLGLTGCGLTPEAKEARFLDAGKKELAKKDYSRAMIQFQNAARIKRNDPEPYYQLGLAYLGLQDYKSAYGALKKALALNPKHLEAQVKLAEIQLLLGNAQDYREAEKDVRGVLAVAPNSPDALNALAVAEWKLGEARNAEMDLVKALNQAPQHLQASLNLAKIKFYQKDFAGAEEIIKKAIAASPNSAAPVMGLGELYMAAGKPDAAEQQYRHAIQLDPKNELALLSLASLYVRSNRADLAEQTYRQLSALPGPNNRSLHAMYLFQTGKRDQSVAEFEKLVNDEPSDRVTRARLIEAYFALGRLPDAEKLLATVLRKNGKDVDALLQMGRVHLAAGNSSDAQRDIGKVLSFQTDSAPAHYLMSKVHESKGATLSQRQELTEALRINPLMLQARLELAQVLLRSGSAKTALQVLDEAGPQKNQLAVVIQRNWALLDLQNMAEARKGIDEGLAQSKAPDLMVQDGLWKFASGKFPEARAALEEALRQNPANLRALETLSRTYLAQNQAAVAVQKVKEYASKQPKSAPFQEYLGLLLMTNGDRAGARAAFTAAKTADPKFTQADLSLGQLDVIEGKRDDARKRLEGILAADSNNLTAHLWLGTLEDKAGNREAAIEHYRKVVLDDPRNAQASNNLAYLLAESGSNLDEAIKYAGKAVELAPEQAAYCDTMGWALYRKGLYTSAITYLERANKGDAISKYHLAMAYAKAGDGDRGRTTLQAALKLNPNVPEAKLAKAVVGESH